jgi:hypothetical protein
MARPLIQIDGSLVEKMASWGCKTIEIADHFGCNEDTITRRFSEELRKGRIALKSSLRQWQLTAAKGGNVTMQIWLGKQLLGQQDVRINLTEIPDEVFQQEAERRLKLVGSS